MPSGFDLLKEICGAKCDADPSSNPMLWNAINIAIIDFNVHTHNEFRERLRKCNLNSVDRFIQDNPKFELYAKACIAHILLEKELKSSKLTVDPDHDSSGSNAFRVIWNELAQSEDTVLELKSHRFVTFNYDRLFEYFLYESLMNSRIDITHEQALAIIEELEIIHVYGSLGQFKGIDMHDYRSNDFTDRTPANRSFKEAVDSLNLLLSHRKTNSNSERVAQHFVDTQKVVVLGFGFDKTNCEYLFECYKAAQIINLKNRDLNTNLSESGVRDCIQLAWQACMYKKTGAESRRIGRLWGLKYEHDGHGLGYANENDARFLAEHVF